MYPMQKSGRSTIVPTAGDRSFSRLINAVQSHYVTLVFRGTLTIAGGAADSIRNRGSILAAFNEVGIDENGTDKVLLDGRVLRHLSETGAPSALSAKRVTSTAAAAYTLEEAVAIQFAHPFAAIPRETAFLERDTKQLFQAFVKLDSAGGGSKLAKVSGGVTAVLSNVSVTVTHTFDPVETARPYFVPFVRQQIAQVLGASTNQQEFIKTSNAIRQMVVTQETTTDGEVNDIINKLLLKGDRHDIIGPVPVKWDDLALASEYEFGGAVVASNRSHLSLNFQDHGRLATVVNPNQDNNLRFEFDCQPSVAGAGTSQIRITLVELVRDPVIVDPVLPIPV
jgi:hypothetical protein